MGIVLRSRFVIGDGAYVRKCSGNVTGRDWTFPNPNNGTTKSEYAAMSDCGQHLIYGPFVHSEKFKYAVVEKYGVLQAKTHFGIGGKTAFPGGVGLDNTINCTFHLISTPNKNTNVQPVADVATRLSLADVFLANCSDVGVKVYINDDGKACLRAGNARDYALVQAEDIFSKEAAFGAALSDSARVDQILGGKGRGDRLRQELLLRHRCANRVAEYLSTEDFERSIELLIELGANQATYLDTGRHLFGIEKPTNFIVRDAMLRDGFRLALRGLCPSAASMEDLENLHHMRKVLFKLGWLQTPSFRRAAEPKKAQHRHRCKMLVKLLAVMYDSVLRKERMRRTGIGPAEARRAKRVAASRGERQQRRQRRQQQQQQGQGGDDASL